MCLFSETTFHNKGDTIMNRLTAFIFTVIVFSLSSTSISFASVVNEQAPQTRDLSLQEMSSVIGAGRIYWQTHASQTWLFQQDSNYHAVHYGQVPQGTHEIGGHDISETNYVYIWCLGNGFKSGQFPMPNHDITIKCY